MFTSDFDRASAGFSPDRLDAAVWGLSELLIKGQQPLTFVLPFYAGASFVARKPVDGGAEEQHERGDEQNAESNRVHDAGRLDNVSGSHGL